MTVQPIHYGGRLVAIATRDWFLLGEELAGRGTEDPERTFVIYMCAYAGDVLSGRLPGSYSDGDARRYARACLIPAELAERPGVDTARAARALRVPHSELLHEQSPHPGASD